MSLLPSCPSGISNQLRRLHPAVRRGCPQSSMDYAKILRLALVPSIVFFLLSLVCVALTTHYWIIGDWIVPRGVTVVTSQFDDRLQRYITDDTIVYFTSKDADATIVSGCLNLTAAVIALIAWSMLRKPGMDSQFAAVRTLRATFTTSRTDIINRASVVSTSLLLLL